MTTRKINILLIEDEDFDVLRVRKTLSVVEDEIQIKDVVSDGSAALKMIEADPYRFDVVIMDFQIAGGLMGEALIRKIKEFRQSMEIIVITKMTMNINDVEFANGLLRAGAYWYCTKYPMDVVDYIYQPTDFILSIKNAYSTGLLVDVARESNEKLDKSVEERLHSKQLIGESTKILRLKEQIKQYAAANVSILIEGPSGSGKEIVAHNIHLQSNRKFESFIPINCGSLPFDLIESELFGFEKGAFTGALREKKGLLELAHKGTVFLDEVAELPLSAQAKLLRFLESGEIEKIGRFEKKTVDVRVISATNRDLKKEVKENRFREDLYYRLAIVNIQNPALSEREGDIILLLEHFLSIYSFNMNKRKPQISAAGLNLLEHYNWPGNIRELKSFTQRIMFLQKELLTDDDVKLALGLYDANTPAPNDIENFYDPANIVPLHVFKERTVKKYVSFILEHTKNDSEAAKKLGLAPSNFSRLCHQLGLKG
jgi:DNA-binding NtrC family response regulator